MLAEEAIEISPDLEQRNAPGFLPPGARSLELIAHENTSRADAFGSSPLASGFFDFMPEAAASNRPPRVLSRVRMKHRTFRSGPAPGFDPIRARHLAADLEDEAAVHAWGC
jgi:hypothetical protein